MQFLDALFTVVFVDVMVQFLLSLWCIFVFVSSTV